MPLAFYPVFCLLLLFIRIPNEPQTARGGDVDKISFLPVMCRYSLLVLSVQGRVCSCHHLLVMQCKIKISHCHCDSFDAAFTEDPHIAFERRHACRLCFDKYIFEFNFYFFHFYFFSVQFELWNSYSIEMRARACTLRQPLWSTENDSHLWHDSRLTQNSVRMRRRQSVFFHHWQFLIRELHLVHVEGVLPSPLFRSLSRVPWIPAHLHAIYRHPPHELHMCRWLSLAVRPLPDAHVNTWTKTKSVYHNCVLYESVLCWTRPQAASHNCSCQW